MKKIKVLLSVFACLPIIFSSAHAGSRAGELSLMASGGEFYFGSKRVIKNTPLFMLGAAYHFSDAWGITTELGLFKTDFKSYLADSRRVRGFILLVNAVHYFSSYGAFQPYGMLGTGIIGLDHNQTDAHHEGNINAGLGVSYSFAPSLDFNLEGRDVYTWVGGKNDVLLNAGISYNFDFC